MNCIGDTDLPADGGYRMLSPMKCPNCGEKNLNVFDASSKSMIVLKCSNCGRIATLKNTNGNWQLFMAGVSVCAGLLSIATYFGIDRHVLEHAMNNLIDNIQV
jgi:ribosomal protein S27E